MSAPVRPACPVPLLPYDLPDPDVIRVGESYYMVCTSMYFMPGAPLFVSKDLVNWELCSYIFDQLDPSPALYLEEDKDAYGKGMWAASLRYHAGMFYVCFCTYDSGKTYLFRSAEPKGPWRRSEIEGFYHDSSLLFDDDGRSYLVYGNSQINLVELRADLGGPLAGGLTCTLVSDAAELGDKVVGYEGAHFYKIQGRYSLMLIHWPKTGTGRRVQACFTSDSIDGPYTGGDVFNHDFGFANNGVAQGGLVDTPEGQWYSMLFQDRGAAGRFPVLLGIDWVEGRPVYTKLETTEGSGGQTALVSSDDFSSWTKPECPPAYWQWNHVPKARLWRSEKEARLLRTQTSSLAPHLLRAQNTLTQLFAYPASAVEVEVDASDIHEGDTVGLAVLQGRFGQVGICRGNKGFQVQMSGRPGKPVYPPERSGETEAGLVYQTVDLSSASIRLRAWIDCRNGLDEAAFAFFDKGFWHAIGIRQRLYFGLDHFTGCRFALFHFARSKVGGRAAFRNFVYLRGETEPPNLVPLSA